ncbi:MAG: ABC transporter ATP-binding protein, partial [Pseudomonadota bacterium]
MSAVEETGTAPLLEVRGLRSGYGRVPVLHGIDFAIGDGEILGVLGHNGMGKTTLLKTLMGLVPATAGSVTFDGLDVTREKPAARARLGIGYVPQGRGIFPALSVRDNLAMGVAAHGLADEGAAIEAVLAEFPQIERLLDRRGGALSGGEQQLLALARCLASGPQLLLLDEPTEGIQPSIVDLIEEKLADLARRRGLSILLVEQNLEFITALADRVMVLQKGQVKGVIAGGNAMNADLIAEFTGFASAAPPARAPAAPLTARGPAAPLTARGPAAPLTARGPAAPLTARGPA